jgi:hypothetical protein
LSKDEANMQAIVEDLSEEMKREKEDEMKLDRGAPQIAFMELSTLRGFSGLLYVVGIVGFFGVILYVLVNKVIAKPVDFSQQKKQARDAKKLSKGDSKKSK